MVRELVGVIECDPMNSKIRFGVGIVLIREDSEKETQPEYRNQNGQREDRVLIHEDPDATYAAAHVIFAQASLISA